MTLREHLQEMHKAGADHHVEMGKAMSSLSEQHAALAKATELTDSQASAAHRAAAEACRTAANCHVEHAEKCLAMHKAVGEMPSTAMGPASDKVQGGSEREAALTDLILKLAHGNGVPAGISLIPRHGAPDPRAHDVISKVPAELRHLVHDESESRQ